MGEKVSGCVLTKMPQPRIQAPKRAFLFSRHLKVIEGDFTLLEPATNGHKNVLVVSDVFTKFN